MYSQIWQILIKNIYLYYVWGFYIIILMKMPELEKKKPSEIEMKAIDKELDNLRKEVIEKWKRDYNWQFERWLIDYDKNENKIKSWWNEVKVHRINNWMCKLEWLGLILTLQEWLWLANFKNWLKHKYANEKVVFKQDIKNKNLAFRKTLCVNDTMLITRANLVKHIRLCEYDENMKTLVEWLNN